MGSKYTELYLINSEKRIKCGLPPLTPKTFLSQVLKGKAKKYSYSYYKSLIEDLEELVKCKKCDKVISAKGGIAYVYNNNET